MQENLKRLETLVFKSNLTLQQKQAVSKMIRPYTLSSDTGIKDISKQLDDSIIEGVMSQGLGLVKEENLTEGLEALHEGIQSLQDIALKRKAWESLFFDSTSPLYLNNLKGNDLDTLKSTIREWEKDAPEVKIELLEIEDKITILTGSELFNKEGFKALIEKIKTIEDSDERKRTLNTLFYTIDSPLHLSKLSKEELKSLYAIVEAEIKVLEDDSKTLFKDLKANITSYQKNWDDGFNELSGEPRGIKDQN